MLAKDLSKQVIARAVKERSDNDNNIRYLFR